MENREIASRNSPNQGHISRIKNWGFWRYLCFCSTNENTERTAPSYTHPEAIIIQLPQPTTGFNAEPIIGQSNETGRQEYPEHFMQREEFLLPQVIKDLEPGRTIEKLSEDDVSHLESWSIIQAKKGDIQSGLYDELQLIPAYKGMTRQEMWRLFIDGRYQKGKPRYCLENDIGFGAGVRHAFAFMLKGLGKEKLTARYYEKLHQICVKDAWSIKHYPSFSKDGVEVDIEKEREFGEEIEISAKSKIRRMYPNFRTEAHGKGGFPIASSNRSNKGFAELKKKYDCRQGGPSRDEYYGDAGHPVGNAYLYWEDYPEENKDDEGQVIDYMYKTRPMSAEQCHDEAQRVIDRYYKEIDSIQGIDPEQSDKKLTAIIHCCQDLDQLHLFEDGNIRTIAFILLPKLLIENGLSPTILENPNILDCHAIDEIKDAIYKGQQTFEDVF